MGEAQSKNVSAYDGAIFLCNHLTRKECFHRKIFGLSSKCTDFIHRVKAGATLFLYDVSQHKLHGVFEATSDGAMNIVPDAYASTGFQYPCQIRFKRIWFCKPLMESEFEDAVQDNYFTRNKFTYGLSHQQVVKLLHLFSSRNRLQPRQNPRLQDEQPRESEISSVINQTDNQSGSNSGSHGSLKSPCQTCTSSTVGEDAASPSHKLAKPVSSMHSELQLDISDVAKSNSSRSSLHTAANADIIADPGTQEATDDKFTDDYIPLQLEEDTIDGVDYLSDLLGYESGSSESNGSGDSEEHTTFHQSSGRKEDYCHQPMENSKLRADIEGRKSVFARLLGRPKSFSQKDKSKTKTFASMNAQSFSPLSHSQRKKRRRAQQNKTFRCAQRATFDLPLADNMRRIPALNYSFVRDDNRRCNKFTGEKPSNIQTGQQPYLREDVNEWDVSTKEPDRYDASKNLCVPEGSKQLAESRDRELQKPPVFAEVHESCEVTVKEKIRTPFSDFKRRAKDPNVEGGEHDFETEDVEEAARKKTRLASASNQQEEYQSETALIQDTEPIDILTISNGDCKLKSITLSSNDTYTQMASAYLETEVLLEDVQKRIQGCCEDVTDDKFMNLGDSGNAPKLSFSNSQTILNVETSSEVAFDHLETETSLQEKQNQIARSCYEVVDTDKMLLLENEACGSKICLPSDRNTRHVASDHLVAEIPAQEKQTHNVQICSQVVHVDEVLVPENSEETFPKFDANCERNKSLSSDEAYNHVEASHLDTHVPLQEKPCQRAPDCCEIVDADQEFCRENSVTLETSPKYDRHPVKNSLSSDGISGYVASDLYGSGASPDPDSPECHGDSANKNILPDGSLEMAATDHQEICKLPQDEPFRGLSGTVDTSTGDELSTPEDCGKVDLLPKLSFGDMQTIVETRIEVDVSHVETETSLQDKQQNQCVRSCYGVVNTADKMLHLENPETMEDLSANHDEDGILQMLAVKDNEQAETSLQEKQNQSDRSCYGVVNAADRMLHLENPKTMEDLSANHDEDGIMQMLAAKDNQQAETSVQEKQSQSDRSCYGVINAADKMLHLEKPETMEDLSANHDEDGILQMLAAKDNQEAETSLQEKQNQSDRSCFGVVNAADKLLHLENPETMEDLSPNHEEDGILQMLGAEDHQETFTLTQGKQTMSFCGDSSSVLEYSGTVDTRTVDGDSEHKTSSYQKDAQATYSPTRSEDEEDATNTVWLNGRRSSSPPYDQELSKAVPQPETQHGAAYHENSDSTDPFAVCAEGYRSMSGIPTDSASATHLVVADLLGANSESRTGFFDGFSSELDEMIMFAHDPGEEMEPH